MDSKFRPGYSARLFGRLFDSASENMKAHWKVWLLICGIAVAAGCAHFQPQPLSPEKTAALFDARRLDDPGLRAFLATNSTGAVPEWPLEKWDLNSLTLA